MFTSLWLVSESLYLVLETMFAGKPGQKWLVKRYIELYEFFYNTVNIIKLWHGMKSKIRMSYKIQNQSLLQWM